MKLFRHIGTMFCIVVTFVAQADERPAVSAEGAAKPPAAVELQRLQGTWKGVMVGYEQGATITIKITGKSLHFHRDANFWFETTFTQSAGTDPKELKVTINDGAPGQENSFGELVGAMYKIEEGALTLVALGGGDEEKPKGFDPSEVKGLRSRYELRKVQPKESVGESPKTKSNETPKQ